MHEIGSAVLPIEMRRLVDDTPVGSTNRRMSLDAACRV
jgi:hypothetical protein